MCFIVAKSEVVLGTRTLFQWGASLPGYILHILTACSIRDRTGFDNHHFRYPALIFRTADGTGLAPVWKPVGMCAIQTTLFVDATKVSGSEGEQVQGLDY
jgi:hypothetical protein